MKGFENITYKKAIEMTILDFVVVCMSIIVSFSNFHNLVFVVALIASLVSPVFFKSKWNDFSYVVLMGFKTLMCVIMMSIIITIFLELNSFLEAFFLVFAEFVIAGLSFLLIRYQISQVDVNKKFPEPNMKLYSWASVFTGILVYISLHNRVVDLSDSTQFTVIFYLIIFLLVVFIFIIVVFAMRIYLYKKHKIVQG